MAQSLPEPATPLHKLEFVLLFLLTVLLFIYVTAHLDSRAAQNDAQENLQVGLTLSQTSVYGPTPTSIGYHQREPFIPGLIALMDLGHRVLSFDRANRDCASPEHVTESTCRTSYQSYKILNAFFFALLPIVCFLLTLRLTKHRVLAYGVALWIGLDKTLIEQTHTFVSEVPAAFLVVAATLVSIRFADRATIRKGIGLGVLLAALTLTKVVFAYAWLFILLALVVNAKLQDTFDRRFLVGVTALAAAYAVLVGGYMTRNALQANDFALVENRSYPVHGIRASYNSMSDAEFRAGFTYYLPGSKKDPDLMGRFDIRADNGFRQMGIRAYQDRSEKLSDEGRSPAEVSSELSANAQRDMLESPIQHLKISLLMAYRGLFVMQGFGHESRSRNSTIAQGLGFDNFPRLGVHFPSFVQAVLGIGSFLALLGVALLAWLRRETVLFLAVLLALYSHSVYALVSHFIPRYSVPVLPLRIVALVACLYFVIRGLQKLVHESRLRQSRSNA
ncbi:MAG: phospholipid carrier-dependent glycosyltransferase [Pseudomonadales bacterium]|nr:phospholipid carrier-dependent glycosyltransferase [Pseudomonadales bacterium]